MAHQSPQKAIQIVPNFVKKLVSILMDKPHSSTVKWMPDGNGFKIMNEQKFTSHILPKYYRHANLPSFVRQLNMYGFHKIKDGEESFYKHPCFKKDHPELYSSISRKPERKTALPENSKNVEKVEKENRPEDKKPDRVKQKKKVNFSIEADESSASKNGSNNYKTRKQLLSNVSLKYERKNPRQSTLLEMNQNSPEELWTGRKDQDGLSICDHLEIKAELPQFFESTHKIIFWTPSEILSNLNNQ